MRCLCGFSFTEGALSATPTAKGFAIIRDEDYPEAIRREAAYLSCQDENEQLERIAEAAALVGTGTICPNCGRLCWVGSGETPELSFWKRESVSEG